MSNDSIAQAQPCRQQTSRPRDSQRSKVYKAERRMASWDKNRLETIPEVERWIRKLSKQTRLQTHFPELTRREVEVSDGRGRRSAAGNESGIWLPRWGRFKLVILHELAHVITERRLRAEAPYIGITGWKVKQGAVHGWVFCAVYLKLVHLGIGKAQADELKGHFKALKVRFTEPRKKRPMSEERRAQLREHLQLARAARAKPE